MAALTKSKTPTNDWGGDTMDPLNYIWIGEAGVCICFVLSFFGVQVRRMRGQRWTEEN